MISGPPQSGIGRRRGAAASKKSPVTSFVVVIISFVISCFFILAFHSYYNISSSQPQAIGKTPLTDATQIELSGKGGVTDESLSEEFHGIAGIVHAEMHLVSIDAVRIVSTGDSRSYRGVTGSFCKLDWDQYKKDPPSLPMFRMLVRWKGLKHYVRILLYRLLSYPFM